MITGSVIILCWFTASVLLIKVEGGADIYATFRWSQKLLYDSGRFSVDIPFRFPYFVNPLPKVFMKREKIQLTVNSGFSKEVLLQGTSHPLKVVVFNSFIYTVLMCIWDIKTSSYVHYSVFFYFYFRKKVGMVINCLSCMKLLLRIGQAKISTSLTVWVFISLWYFLVSSLVPLESVISRHLKGKLYMQMMSYVATSLS